MHQRSPRFPVLVTRRIALGAPLAALAVSRLPALAHAQATPSPAVGGWETVAPLPVPRSEYAATVLDGLIYVAGGFGAGTNFDRYDPEVDALESLADLPAFRHHLSLIALDGAIYIAGGLDEAANRATDTFWRYDPAGNAWETLEPLPQGARGSLGGGAIDGKLYIAGGSAGDLSGPATGDLARYDPAEDRWDLLAPMPTPREHLGVAVASGQLVAVGGRDGSHEDISLLSATEIYDPATDAWRTGAALPVPRAGMGATSDGEAVIVIGGERFTTDAGEREPQTIGTVDRYDVAEDAWSQLEPLPVPRHGIVAAVVDGMLYAIGGATVAGTAENTTQVDRLAL
jgi:N-acetylneuraminic acid mutarotase